MAQEHIGEQAVIQTADHPARSDSPAYKRSRKTLMEDYGGGCFVCSGPVDLSHPEVADAKALGLEDHHGGGLYAVIGDRPVLVGLGLLQMEWSEGWGADPKIVQRMVNSQNIILSKLGSPIYDKPITDDASVMDYVDSIFNANVKLCKPHHTGHTKVRSKDARGHEAVGIHNVPLPVFLYQSFCDWEHWDMFAGTTGSIVVAPTPHQMGHATVLHMDEEHGDEEAFRAFAAGDQVILKPSHRFAMQAHRTEKYQ